MSQGSDEDRSLQLFLDGPVPFWVLLCKFFQIKVVGPTAVDLKNKNARSLAGIYSSISRIADLAKQYAKFKPP
jgi:hypothetical protein